MSVYPAVPAVSRIDLAPDAVCEVYELGSRRRTPAAVRELTTRQVAIGRMMSTGAKDAAIAREFGAADRALGDQRADLRPGREVAVPGGLSARPPLRLSRRDTGLPEDCPRADVGFRHG